MMPDKYQGKYPASWKMEYDLKDTFETPDGQIHITLGLDAFKYFPRFLAASGKLVLSKSQITGKLLTAGKVDDDKGTDITRPDDVSDITEDLVDKDDVTKDDLKDKNEIANDNITEESFEDNRGNEKPNESYPSAREVIEDKIVDVQGIDVTKDVEEIPTNHSVQAKTDEIKDIIDDDIVNKDLKMVKEAKFKEEISTRAFDPGDFEHK